VRRSNGHKRLKASHSRDAPAQHRRERRDSLCQPDGCAPRPVDPAFMSPPMWTMRRACIRRRHLQVALNEDERSQYRISAVAAGDPIRKAIN